MTGAIADCERVAHAFWGQPVNAVTALAFVVAGLIVAAGTGRRRVGVALVATGMGSFLFHGPMPSGSEWAHDVSLAWLLVVAGAEAAGAHRWSGLPALAVLGVWFWALPTWADPMCAVLAVGAIGTILLRDRSRRTVLGVSLLAVAAMVGRLSATGHPWCRPDSLLQGHGFWHVASAAAVLIWATSPRPA
jgi:hypothetical protein